jgi:sugar phosphate isomerase/epimerase
MNNLGFHCHHLYQIDEGVRGNGLRRGEFYHFPVDDLQALRDKIRSERLAASIHTPLVAPEWYPNPPTWAFLCDLDEGKRKLNLRMVRETLGMAQQFGVEYIVVHYPSPSAADNSGASLETQREIATDSARLLAELSTEYDVPIHLEGFGPSPFLSTKFLIEVMEQFPCLRYCFDTGHMWLAYRRDGLDFSCFAEEIAPYLGSIHLWNTRGLEDYYSYRHIPVHPSQKPEDGWVDIPAILGTLLDKAGSKPVVLESGYRYPAELGGYDYREGVRWVKEVLGI